MWTSENTHLSTSWTQPTICDVKWYLFKSQQMPQHRCPQDQSIIDVWRQQHGAWKKACRTSYCGFLSFPITNEWTFMKSPLNLQCSCMTKLLVKCVKFYVSAALQKCYIRHTQSCCYLIRLKTDIARDTVRHVFSTSPRRCVKQWLFRTVLDALLNMYQY